MRRAIVPLGDVDCDVAVMRYAVTVDGEVGFIYNSPHAAGVTISRLKDTNPNVEYDIQEVWHCSHTMKEILEDGS